MLGVGAPEPLHGLMSTPTRGLKGEQRSLSRRWVASPGFWMNVATSCRHQRSRRQSAGRQRSEKRGSVSAEPRLPIPSSLGPDPQCQGTAAAQSGGHYSTTREHPFHAHAYAATVLVFQNPRGLLECDPLFTLLRGERLSLSTSRSKAPWGASVLQEGESENLQCGQIVSSMALSWVSSRDAQRGSLRAAAASARPRWGNDFLTQTVVAYPWLCVGSSALTADTPCHSISTI
jgi:hypothetical protein